MRTFIGFLFVLIAFSGCIFKESSDNAFAYEVFIASVERIIVDKEINVSEPVRIGIEGYFEDDCSELASLATEKSDSIYNIELIVYGKRKLNTRCNIKRVIYSGSITITGLAEGRYRIRINKSDELVEYFSVVSGNTLDSGAANDTDFTGCVEEIAPVSMADITIDGFNSVKDQKISYGTPISLIVKGSISGDCRGFKGFKYERLGNNLYIDVLASYCPDSCDLVDYKDYRETYVITGLSKGKYILYVNNSIVINFEVVD